MAVTLTQASQQAGRQRSWTASANMPWYDGDTAAISMPRQILSKGEPTPAAQYCAYFAGSPQSSTPSSYRRQSSSYNRPPSSNTSYSRPSYEQPSLKRVSQDAQLQDQHSYHQLVPDALSRPASISVQTKVNDPTILFAGNESPTIEPDPLPPHSNPQALTQSQSEAFTGVQPLSPVRVGKDEVYSSTTGLSQYVVSREAAHMPSFISTKPILTIRKVSTGNTTGTIRFHALMSQDIEMTVNGRRTSISQSRSLLHSKRWGFQSTSIPNQADRWFWKKDKSTGGAMLEDSSKSKHAHVLARMKGDLLTFEKANLSDASYDEIVLSAIAMAEAARRAGKGKDIADLASAIGDFAASEN